MESRIPLGAAIFDLDNTLYPEETGLFAAIERRIGLYVQEKLKLSPAEADERRRRWRRRYQITLRGLMVEHGVPPEEFLEFVHRVPVDEMLAPDPCLASLLAALPCPRYVFTNASREHARRVLARLGVAELISGTFDIASAGYLPKADARAFRRVLELCGCNPTETVYIDDLPANLETAAALGLTTILVGQRFREPGAAHYAARDLEELGVILRRLAGGS